MKKLLSFFFLSVIVFNTKNTNAQWTNNTAINTPISTPTGGQTNNKSIPDGAGGAIITWTDSRSGDNDVYAQRINAQGFVQWTTNGIVIASTPEAQAKPAIVSDGNGGAIITWDDSRNGNYDIYAQRIDSLGNELWTSNGVPICIAINSQQSPVITSDSLGGAIITWTDQRAGSFNDLYAQRINAAGLVQWTVDGVAICTMPGDQRNPAIVPDGANGAIIAWQDKRFSDYDIYAQNINSAGLVQWITNGIVICAAANNQLFPVALSDDSGGAIIAWGDDRTFSTTDFDSYAQRVNAGGVVQWTVNGVAICTAIGDQMSDGIITDNAGGAIIYYSDERTGTYDMYAQRINPAGVVQWTMNGLAVSTAANQQIAVSAVSDDAGGIILAWQDERILGDINIYAQWLNASGTAQWITDGIPVATATGTQALPRLVFDPYGQAIVSWYENRSGNYDVYAQNICLGPDLTTSLSGLTITANQNGASYQWLNCDSGNSPIPGETYQNYTATANGNYSVIVTRGACSDTSACVNVSSVGIGNPIIQNELLVSLYPNPVSGSFHLASPKENIEKIEIYDLSGRVILKKENIHLKDLQLEFDSAKGMYFIFVHTENDHGILKFIKD